MSDQKNLYCSFCGKSQHQVKKLIAGPNVFICDECVELCTQIVYDAQVENVVKRCVRVVMYPVLRLRVFFRRAA